MPKKPPSNTNATEGNQEPKKRKLNWDVIGIASTAITLVGSAIFYISGWVYQAHWYGYYGVNVSQVELSPPQVAVQGIPGVLLFAVAIMAFLGLAASFKASLKKGPLLARDITLVIFLVSVGADLFLAFYIPRNSSPDLWSDLPSDLLVIWSSSLITAGVVIGLAILVLSMFVFIAILHFIYARIESRSTTPDKSESICQTWVESTRLAIELPRHAWQSVLSMVTDTRQLTLGLSLLFLLLLSMAASALLAEDDARRGVRSLEGGWHLVPAYLLSDHKIELLPTPATRYSQDNYEYGPLALVARNGNVFYLIDWQDGVTFDRRPSLYVVEQTDDQPFQLFSPRPTPTPTAMPPPTPTATPPSSSVPTVASPLR